MMSVTPRILHAEHAAFAAFLAAWGSPAAEIAEQHAAAESIKKALNQHLWHWDDVGPSGQREGWYAAYDVAARRPVLNRTYQMAWPLWAGLAETTEQTEAAVRAVLAPDMWTPWGIRSTSARDPRYNNENIIVPYSNWKVRLLPYLFVLHVIRGFFRVQYGLM
jgi:alpha,alpha-trehalase